DLFGLPPIHVSEKPDTLDGSHGVALGRDWRRRFASGFPGSDGAALQEIELAILDRPFDVAPRAVNLLAPQSELTQGGELGIIQAELVHLRRRNLLFESAPGRERADGYALAASQIGRAH